MLTVPFRKTLSVLSVDATFGKTHKDADFVAIEAWGYAAPHFLCYDSNLERRTFESSVEAIRDMMAIWPAHFILVEDAANGPAIIETLSGTFPNVVAIPPRGGKETRARAASHLFSARRVLFSAGAPWLERKLSNLARFPRGKHDDDVDATTQALLWMLQEYASGADYGMAVQAWREERTELETRALDRSGAAGAEAVFRGVSISR